jgi:hypothetical protein
VLSTAPPEGVLREVFARLLGEGVTPPWRRRWNTRTRNAKSFPSNSPSGIVGASITWRAASSMPQVLKNSLADGACNGRLKAIVKSSMFSQLQCGPKAAARRGNGSTWVSDSGSGRDHVL